MKSIAFISAISFLASPVFAKEPASYNEKRAVALIRAKHWNTAAEESATYQIKSNAKDTEIVAERTTIIGQVCDFKVLFGKDGSVSIAEPKCKAHSVLTKT